MPGWGENSVSLRGGGVRPAVCGKGKFQSSQGFLKGNVGKNRVGAYAHNLGVQLGKLREIFLDCREFVPSNRGEVQGIKSNNDPLASVIRKLEFLLLITYRRLEIEIRRRISNVQWHACLLSAIWWRTERLSSAI